MFPGENNLFTPARSIDHVHRRLIFIFTLAICLFGAARAAGAAQWGDSAEGLTDSLVKLYGEHGKAPEPEKSLIVTRMQKVALARRQALLARISTNPGAVLNAALPVDLGRKFPRVVRDLLEQEVEIDGELEILHEDLPRGSRFHYTLKSHGELYRLHFRKDPPSGLSSGARVRAYGVRLEHELAVDSGTTGLQSVVAALPNTLSEQRTLVILVNFKDNPAQPYLASDAQDLVFTTVNEFLLENSYRQTYLSGEVRGWYTIDMNRPTSNCDYHQIASKADAAAEAAGVTLSSFNRKIYAFPQAKGCSWWGLGTVGGNPSRAWINGELKLRVVAHELGHNLGLYHSHSLDCGSVTLGHVCNVSEYGDSMDTMGSAAFHFNAFQKERLGWLNRNPSPPITSVQAAGSYKVSPFETVGTASKALKIFRSVNPSNGRRSYFYAECRRPIGFDAGVASHPNVLGGFLLHIGEENTGNSSYLLDLTPETSTWADPALTAGRSFSDPVAGVTITPDVPCSDNLEGLLTITFGYGACARSAPEVTLGSAPNQWILPGKSVSYPVNLVNHDENCGATNFALTPVLPQGWSATMARPLLTVDSGESKATTLTITAPQAAAEGLHSFHVTATHSADAALISTASGTIAVVSSLGVQASLDAPTLTVTRMAFGRVSVTLNDAPVAKARVRIFITRPDGRVRRAVVRTNAEGIAIFKYRLGKRYPLGTYEVSATAKAGGLDGNARVNFLLR